MRTKLNSNWILDYWIVTIGAELNARIDKTKKKEIERKRNQKVREESVDLGKLKETFVWLNR